MEPDAVRPQIDRPEKKANTVKEPLQNTPSMEVAATKTLSVTPDKQIGSDPKQDVPTDTVALPNLGKTSDIGSPMDLLAVLSCIRINNTPEAQVPRDSTYVVDANDTTHMAPATSTTGIPTANTTTPSPIEKGTNDAQNDRRVVQPRSNNSHGGIFGEGVPVRHVDSQPSSTQAMDVVATSDTNGIQPTWQTGAGRTIVDTNTPRATVSPSDGDSELQPSVRAVPVFSKAEGGLDINTKNEEATKEAKPFPPATTFGSASQARTPGVPSNTDSALPAMTNSVPSREQLRPSLDETCRACKGRWVLHSCGRRAAPFDYEAAERVEREKQEKKEEQKRQIRAEKRKIADAKRREARKKKQEEDKRREAAEARAARELQRKKMAEDAEALRERNYTSEHAKDQRRADMLQRLEDDEQRRFCPPKTPLYTDWPGVPTLADPGPSVHTPNNQPLTHSTPTNHTSSSQIPAYTYTQSQVHPQAHPQAQPMNGPATGRPFNGNVYDQDQDKLGHAEVLASLAGGVSTASPATTTSFASPYNDNDHQGYPQPVHPHPRAWR